MVQLERILLKSMSPNTEVITIAANTALGRLINKLAAKIKVRTTTTAQTNELAGVRAPAAKLTLERENDPPLDRPR